MIRAACQRIAVCGAALVLAACSNTAQVTRGGGVGINEAQRMQMLPRIAVGGIIDKTDPATDQSLTHQLVLINGRRQPEQQEMTVSNVTLGIRDMLTTELFGSGKFIVLEREALKDVLVEQEFSQSRGADAKTRIPLGQLEGAQLLVLGAITAFDAGLDGGALPIPVPLSRRGDFGVLQVSGKRGYVAMDLRIIDVKTGRVLSSTAVEGRNWRFGLDLTGFFHVGHGTIALPGLMRYFNNTPVEEALQKMVIAAVERISENSEPLK